MPEQPTEPAASASSRGRPLAMLRYAAVCLLVAVIAGVRGFGIFAGASGAGVSSAMALVERDGAGRADRLHHAAGGRARAVRGGRAASLKRGGGPLAACFARRRGVPPSMPLSSPPRRPA
ncbi:DUF1328 domain-containing protein [Burkholderia gladioli]|uniref:DUF1328 domain-containing protein n=1 Tax=Burkholderia gladioli TaxID=28095 RepID=UPI00163F888A|nr:hypothetical protein [Burkholderia gladioli]